MCGHFGPVKVKGHMTWYGTEAGGVAELVVSAQCSGSPGFDPQQHIQPGMVVQTSNLSTWQEEQKFEAILGCVLNRWLAWANMRSFLLSTPSPKFLT